MIDRMEVLPDPDLPISRTLLFIVTRARTVTIRDRPRGLRHSEPANCTALRHAAIGSFEGGEGPRLTQRGVIVQ